VYTLFPDLKDFEKDSPCQSKTCRWFRAGGNPEYLLIDTGESWSSLNYLGSRDDFLNGISNLLKNGNIKLLLENKTTRLFKVIKKI